MLDKLSSAIKKATDKIANAVFLDKTLVDEIVKELQRALIEADVNVSLVLEITKKIKQAALDERIKGIEKREHLIKLLHDELLGILGESREIKLGKKNTFMMLGLYGAGKTTTISKLALYYSKRGHKVAAIGLDVHRPAASDQLKQLGERSNFAVFIDKEEKDPIKIWKKYEKELSKYDLILVDTAGRDSLDDALISEIKAISKIANPTETFLVLQADIGQAAQKQARVFKEAVQITGVIITRMDSTAKAGGALTACHEAKVPVIFIGTGEKPHDLEHFEPESFLSRLLGMGDLKSLMEKIQSLDSEKLKQSQKNIQEGKLTLRDVQAQLESAESIGGMEKIMSMMPGLGKAREKITDAQLEQQQKKMKNYKNAINSMTEEEINNPELLEKQTTRIQRIAKGAGVSTTDIRALIKQYKMLQDLVKNQSAMSSGKIDQKTLMKMARK
ncbi:signal recognition particle protein, partial [Candidatus Pacearchaeota archaeon CG_4_9_14_0_2_um_filter_39_13]